MIVEIKDLGYVKDAKINLAKDLIVLCGPNNTGKTYVAYAIYGLMKRSSINSRIRGMTNRIEKLFETGELELDLFEILDKAGTQILDKVSKEYVKEINNVFASSKVFFNKTSIKIELNDLDALKERIFKDTFVRGLEFLGGGELTFNKKKDSSKLQCLFLIKTSERNRLYHENISTSLLTNVVEREIQNLFLGFFFPKSYIAPAERIAINLFSKELSLKRNILVDELLDLKSQQKIRDPFDLVNRRATRYPLPVRDSLEIAEDLNNFKKNIGNFKEFADELEHGILKGKVAISKEGEVLFKPQKGKVTLPIHLSSSAVKSLSNLVIYFRHLATENDFIIIDEPELNLHPDNQVLIARIIAKIVNKGFKVLVNTHSDYIIRELNNLIMLSQKPKYSDEFNYSQDEFLRPEKVEALLFHYKTRKVETLKVSEAGFEVETIDSITNELNIRSQSLYFDSFSQDDNTDSHDDNADSDE